MKAAKAVHPSPDQLKAFALGKLSPDASTQLEAHLGDCATCCQAVLREGDDTLVDRLRSACTPNHPGTQGLTGAAATLAPDPGPPPDLTSHSRYRLVRKLGAGGMGVVYQAEHRLMERSVALKVISRGLMRDPKAVERFRQEVKAAARLSHPNIVTAHDAEQAGDSHFLVMEFVEGVSLAHLVEKRGPLPLHQACAFIRQAAIGLQHAFEQGMVHRDIKPQNLMVTRKGQVKILDFGLARFAKESNPLEPLEQGNLESLSASLTAAGMVVGTPDFIAPEQAMNSRQVDTRADLYGLGCTLYYLLTARVPFPDGSPVEKLFAHVEQQAVPVNQLRKEVPVSLARVVAKMMAKDPAQRYQTPAEVAQALEPFALGKTPLVGVDDLPGATPLPAGLGGRTALAVRQGLKTLLAPSLRRLPGAVRSRPRFVGMAAGAALLLLGVWLAWSLLADSGQPGTQKTAGAAPGTQPRRPRSVLLVLAPRNFHHPDYVNLRGPLDQAGVKTVVASSTMQPAQPDNLGGGTPVQPDVLVSQARAADYDAILFGGGMGVEEYFADRPQGPTVRRLIGEFLAANKPVAAACSGPAILADAEVLRGKRATAFPQARQKVIAHGAIWVDERVVRDGFLLTGDGPTSAGDLSRELLRLLNGAR